MWMKEMFGTDLYHIIAAFLIYSVLGWFVESIYMSICNHKITNRGFARGPFCPIYGFGGVLGYLALLCKQELILAVVGGLFVAETLSVIMQVSYFRWTGGKRLFRMAPLHHHFELKGIPESKIIIRFWITSALLGLVALSVLKLR